MNKRKSRFVGRGLGVPHKRKRSLVFGIGVNDYCYSTGGDTNRDYSYIVWKSILFRCYSNKFHRKRSSYSECSICDEWKIYSNFKKWFYKNYIRGYQLDKDILIKGNKLYSPNACCFVPPEINTLIINARASRGSTPIGVSERIYESGKKVYRACIRMNCAYVCLGTFDTQEGAFVAYKSAKEAYIQEIATKYYNDKKITKNVYDALLKYKIEITD